MSMEKLVVQMYSSIDPDTLRMSVNAMSQTTHPTIDHRNVLLAPCSDLQMATTSMDKTWCTKLLSRSECSKASNHKIDQ